MISALAIFDLVVLLYLLVATPFLGRWFFRRLKRWSDAGLPDARTKSYTHMLLTEWPSTLVLTALWFILGRDADSLGLSFSVSGWQWLGLGLGAVAVIGQLMQMKLVMDRPDELAKLRKSIGELEALTPHNDREERMFMGVSVTAGVCEEILYRGMLLALLAPLLGTWGAVVMGAVIFGLGHVYQGWTGILKTGIVGLVMGALTVFSGSLFAAIALHSVIDYSSGRMMRCALDSESGPMPAASGADPAAGTSTS